MSHTPGPWEIYDEEYDDVLGYQEPKIIANGDNRALVHEIATIRIGLAATPANASLIAAAPELLAEAKAARIIYAVIAARENTPMTKAALARIDAVIAKATGEKSE